MNSFLKKLFFLCLICNIITGILWTQEATPDIAPELEDIPELELKVDPIFPAVNNNIIIIEGEDAVSTNYANQAILNYSCSNNRALQLNRSTALQGGASFYADFLFLIQENGTYELWYGGTPTGPREDLYESYSSPFNYIIDDGEEKPAYREDIQVVERYSPNYYWNKVGDVELTSGQHKIRFQVSERRRYDSKYFFYLDCFFLVKKEGEERVLGSPLPEFFPQDMENRSIDHPFKYVDDYLIIARDNPENTTPLIELSLAYCLLGDNLNALKYIKRALLIDPENQELHFLAAKNNMWKGDINEGLRIYKEILQQDPSRIDIWIDAGMQAAFRSQWSESIQFLENALEYHPDNLNLQVNLGIVLNWAGEVARSDNLFEQIFKTAQQDPALLKKLARFYINNLLPDKAIDVYAKAISIFPAYIEFYLLLEELYLNTGKTTQAQAVRRMVEKSFNTSARLDEYLAIQREKQGLKEQLIKDYRRMLAQQPDNLELREILAQTLFWNGLRSDAIAEYLNILTNHAYRSIKEMEQSSFNLLEAMDKCYIIYNYFNSISNFITEKHTAVSREQQNYNNALRNYENSITRIKQQESIVEQLTTPISDDPEGTKEEQRKKRLQEEEMKLAQLKAEQEQIKNELKEAEDNLSYILQQGEVLLENYEIAKNKQAALLPLLKELSEKESKDKEAFSEITEYNKWQWDREGMVTELRENADRGLILANHLLGKIYQAEKNFNQAENMYRLVDESSKTSNPDASYALSQLLIWQGKMQDYFQIMDTNKYDVSIYAPYTAKLNEYLDLFQTEGGGTFSLENYNQKVNQLFEKFKGLDVDAQQYVKNAYDSLILLHEIYYNKMVRSIYRYQENTFLLRNELGNFYLTEKIYDRAIRQFNMLLALDPWDISAVYRLGQVYNLNGQWDQAMIQLRKVYNMDPRYENAVGLYNQLAERYADTLKFSSYYQAEPTKFNLHSQINYKTIFNTSFELEAIYQSDYNHFYKTYGEDLKPYSYHTHDLALRLPIHINTNFTLTPHVGTVLLLADSFYKDEEATFDNALGIGEFYEYTAADPYAYLDTNLTVEYLEDSFYIMNLSGGYKRYHECFSYYIDNVWDIWWDMSMSMSFGFIEFWPLDSLTIRPYGGMDFLTDDNFFWQAGGELSLVLFDNENPYTVLSLIGNGSYSDSRIEESDYEYYLPLETLLVEGVFSFYTVFYLAEKNALCLNLQAGGGIYDEYILIDDTKRQIKVRAEGTIEYVFGNATFYIGPYFSSTYRYDSGLPEGQNPWNYWSMSFNVGYYSSLPKLLIAQ